MFKLYIFTHSVHQDSHTKLLTTEMTLISSVCVCVCVICQEESLLTCVHQQLHVLIANKIVNLFLN